MLRKQLDGEDVVQDLLEDEATQAKKFDEKEKRMLAMQEEIEKMTDKLEKASRVKAELAQGISILSQKMGCASDDQGLP